MTNDSCDSASRTFADRMLALLLVASVLAAFIIQHRLRLALLLGLAAAVGAYALSAGDSQRGSAAAVPGVGLEQYRVVTEALPIAGIASDLSGLTYDPVRRSLFAITNKRTEIIELSLQGEVLRRWPVSGLDDPEAIEYVAPGLFVIADERSQTLVELRIDESVARIDATSGRRLSIGIERNGNKGFEGLAYDVAGDRLFVAKEKRPLRIYEVRGFPSLGGGTARSLHIASDAKRDGALKLKDLSSLHFHAPTGHLLLLSDESRQIVELDAGGQVRDKLSLKKGRHGLKKDVPQAEGMAMDDQGRLYVVSEPNLFYVFARGQ